MSRTRRAWQRARADARRHGGVIQPAVWPLLAWRFGRWATEDCPALLRPAASKGYGLVALGVEIATGSRLHREVEVGEGLHLIHSGGLKIHPNAIIGDRVGMMHDVTIGVRPDLDGAPVIEDDVFIGPGARVIGPVRVGRGATISANSLVITDVPPETTVMGVPARPLPKAKSYRERPR